MTSEACASCRCCFPVSGSGVAERDETPLRGRAGRVHVGRGVLLAAVRHSKSPIGCLRHGPNLAHPQTRLYNRFTLRNRS